MGILIFPVSTNAQINEKDRKSEYQLALKLGDQFYFSRYLPGNAEKSLNYYHEALALYPRSGEAAWRIARALWSISRYELDKDTKIKSIQDAIRYAEKSVQWAPDVVNTQFWLGACYAEYVNTVGIWKSWNYVTPIKKQMEVVLRMDSKFAGAYHVLGAWHYKAPWWIEGSKEKGIELLYKAVEYQPDYTPHFIRLAHYLLEQNRKEEAAKIIRQMREIKEPFDISAAAEDREIAQELILKYNMKIE